MALPPPLRGPRASCHWSPCGRPGDAVCHLVTAAESPVTVAPWGPGCLCSGQLLQLSHDRSARGAGLAPTFSKPQSFLWEVAAQEGSHSCTGSPWVWKTDLRGSLPSQPRGQQGPGVFPTGCSPRSDAGNAAVARPRRTGQSVPGPREMK